MRDLDRVLSTRCAVLRTSGMSGTLNLHHSLDQFQLRTCRSFQSSEHREELQCHVEEVTSLGRCDDRSTTGVCAFRVIDRGNSETHRRMETSCAHVQMERHPEFHLDCVYMGRATEDRESWMCGFSKIARDEERENVQRCVNVDKLVNATITSIVQALTVAESNQEVKFGQETSITDAENTLMGELRSAGGSNNASKESPMSASTENALIEKSVREMQSTSSMVHGSTSDPGSARPHVTISQPSVPDVKTACERRKRKSCRKALVKLDELVMLMMIDKPEHQPHVNSIMLDHVDRSDEVVVGMTDRVVKARIVYRVPKEQRDGATIREEQQTSAEIAEGELVNAACVASVRSTGKVMELREDKARWFRIKRGVELAKCGESKDCDGCRVAASGDEVARLHGKECRERIRAAAMCDDAGQQRLRTAEERLAPTASAARAEAAQEGLASPARVELAQESRDEEMSDACVPNNAENAKPRVEILREDSTEAISRMEDQRKEELLET